MLTTIAAALWQEQDIISGRSAHLLMIFIGISAFALASQALVMIVMAFGAARAQKQLAIHVQNLNDKLEPLLLKTDHLVTDLGPQVKDIAAKVAVISANVENISGQVREKLIELGPSITAARITFNQANETAREANLKTRQQLVRVDAMVTGVLDATAQAGRVIQHAIDVPIREAAAIVDGVKAALNTFIRGSGKPKVYRAPIGTFTPTRNPPPRLDAYPSERPNLEP